MRRKQMGLRVGAHQHQARFVQQTRKLIARGSLFEILQQIEQLARHHIRDEHAHAAACAILHRREHLDIEEPVTQTAFGGGRARGSETSLRSEIYTEPGGLWSASSNSSRSVIEMSEQRLANARAIGMEEATITALSVYKHDLVEIGK